MDELPKRPLPTHCGLLAPLYRLPMSRADRVAQQLESLEREYRAVLTRALEACAAGTWGLFGHNEHTGFAEAPRELEALRALAKTMDRLRERAGDGPFDLHQQFETARGRAGPNEPGEPKQAKAWLQRLANA